MQASATVSASSAPSITISRKKAMTPSSSISLHEKPVLMVYWQPPRAKLPGVAHVQGNAMTHAVQTPSFSFFLWKKAYMSIDANHVRNPKDR